MPNYYGLAEIVDLVVEDVNGNKTRYVNSAHSHYGEYGYEWNDESAIYCDLSAGNFWVKGANAHCSDYIITTEKLSDAETDHTSNTDSANNTNNEISKESPDTGDNVFLLYVVCIIIALGSVKVFTNLKHSKE